MSVLVVEEYDRPCERAYAQIQSVDQSGPLTREQ
jgi:hypothetical protein